MFELDAVRDIGDSRLLGSSFLLLTTLVGAKDPTLLILPNRDRSPALCCARAGPGLATDHHPSGCSSASATSRLPRDMLPFCRSKASFSLSSFSLAAYT